MSGSTSKSTGIGLVAGASFMIRLIQYKNHTGERVNIAIELQDNSLSSVIVKCSERSSALRLIHLILKVSLFAEKAASQRSRCCRDLFRVLFLRASCVS